MSIIIIVLIVFMFIFLIKFFSRFRYEYSYFPLYIFTLLQKRNFKIANTIESIKETLLLSDKGNCIEELIASPAWLPILSLESVNGDKWIELKKNFLIFQRHLPSVSELGSVTKFQVKNFLESNLEPLDSKYISILTLKIFLKWLFPDAENKDLITQKLLLDIYESSVEYRKEIACKGVGCMRLKQRAVDQVANLLKQSERYKSIFENWSLPEYYSVVLQPFIISPMINVSDIAVSIEKYKSNYDDDIDSFVDNCILMEHPFPILERYDNRTNTQIFISLCDLKKIQNGSKFNFGYGPRSCLGRVYAKEFLKEFFGTILQKKM